MHAGRSVYNMGMGGYSPPQNLAELSKGLALSPGVVIATVNLASDLIEAYRFARSDAETARLLPEGAAAALRRLDESASPDKGPTITGAPTAAKGPRTRVRFRDHIKLYGLVRALWFAVTDVDPLAPDQFEMDIARMTPVQRANFSVVRGPEWRTILTSRYRLPALDRMDPRVRAGLDVVAAVLGEMAVRVRATGADFLVVLLPTKERVFATHVARPSEHPGLPELVENEAQDSEEVKRRLDALGIPCVDVLEPLRSARLQPFFVGMDGHPNATGQALIAEAVARALAERPRPPAS